MYVVEEDCLIPSFCTIQRVIKPHSTPVSLLLSHQLQTLHSEPVQRLRRRPTEYFFLTLLLQVHHQIVQPLERSLGRRT